MLIVVKYKVVFSRTKKSELLNKKLVIVENVDGAFNSVAFGLQVTDLGSAFDLHCDQTKGRHRHNPPSRIKKHFFIETNFRNDLMCEREQRLI